jgi:hypothetical protein
MVFPGVQKSTWSFDEQAKAWYFHRFYDLQPDLNISHPEVQAEILKVVADGLGDGENVGFGERPAQRRAAMPAGAKADQLTEIIEIRLALEIFAFEPDRIDQHFLWRRLACQG